MGTEQKACIDALFDTTNPALRQADPEGMQRYIFEGILKYAERRALTWGEFLAERPDFPQPCPLVYDRPSRLVFVGGYGDHERLAAELYHLRQLTEVPDWESAKWMFRLRADYARYADLFILTGMGFLCGSVSACWGRRSLLVGSEIRLTPEEQRVFSLYERIRH